jgi:hypothetical protein
MKRYFFTLITTSLFTFASQAQITSTESLLKEMHNRYHGKFYRHITFVQLNKIFRDGAQIGSSVWYEAFEYPGKLRVDYGPTVGKDGYIFIHDSIYYFKDGMMERKEKKINESMLLQGDIYCLPIPTIIEKLKALGYDITKFREDKWNDKSVYVIGAALGDDTTRQFWIDRQFMYLVRHITNENGLVQEIHFSEHEAKGKFYIEDEVKIMESGKVVKTERYAEVNPDIVLPDAVFDPNQWGKVHWKK